MRRSGRGQEGTGGADGQVTGGKTAGATKLDIGPIWL
jgi:hypothetical protein